MKTFFGIFFSAGLVAVSLAAGYGFFAGDARLNRAMNSAANVFSAADAEAHVGGKCYLDDNNLQTVENACYSKCRRYFSDQKELSGCEVGCSAAISIATKP